MDDDSGRDRRSNRGDHQLPTQTDVDQWSASRRPRTDGGSGSGESDPGVTYDIDDRESPSEAVLRAVAAVTNTEIHELTPLYDVVDPDQLDAIFEAESGEPREVTVSFACNGCRVTVSGDAVHVRPDVDG